MTKNKKNNLLPDDVETWWHYVQSMDQSFHQDRLDALRQSLESNPGTEDEQKINHVHAVQSESVEPIAVHSVKNKPPAKPALVSDQINGLTTKQLKRFRQGDWDIDATLDLHGLTLLAAREAVFVFLLQSVQQRKRCLLVITGKGSALSGSGVIRRQIISWLEQSPNRADILGISPSHPKDGGEGAVYVLLRRKRNVLSAKKGSDRAEKG